ncbi:MAG TPA: HD domain-containing phosphohydrolase, partial [Gaiellaceae bacterium]|nr:HD domain-containing phosphohydrolase [Gaiellaceae bacterium]
TEAEWRLMQTHASLGAQLLGGVAFLRGKGVDIVRSHHERWDGAGYPDGLERTARRRAPRSVRRLRGVPRTG